MGLTLDQLKSFIAQKIPVSIFRGVNAANLKVTLNTMADFVAENTDTQQGLKVVPNDGSITEAHIDLLAMQVMDGEVAKAALSQTTINEFDQEHVLPPILGRIVALKDGNVIIEPPSQMMRVKLASEADGGNGYEVLPVFIYKDYLIAWRNGTVIKYADFLLVSGFTPEQFDINEGEVFGSKCQLYYGLKNGNAGDVIEGRLVPDATATQKATTVPLELDTNHQKALFLQGEDDVEVMANWGWNGAKAGEPDVISGMYYIPGFGKPFICVKGTQDIEQQAEMVEESPFSRTFFSGLKALMTPNPDEPGLTFVMSPRAGSFVSTIIDLGEITFGNLNVQAAATKIFYDLEEGIPSGFYPEKYFIKFNTAFTATSDISSVTIGIREKISLKEHIPTEIWITPSTTTGLFITADANENYVFSVQNLQRLNSVVTALEFIADFDPGVGVAVNPQDFLTGSLNVFAVIKPFLDTSDFSS